MSDFELLGHDCPLGKYPAPVVPIGQHEGKLVAAYPGEHGAAYVAVDTAAAYVRHAPELATSLRGFDPASERLFALDATQVVKYAGADEVSFFLALLARADFSADNPFLRLSLAKATGRADAILPELKKSLASLDAKNPTLRSAWYRAQREAIEKMEPGVVSSGMVPMYWHELLGVPKASVYDVSTFSPEAPELPELVKGLFCSRDKELARALGVLSENLDVGGKRAATRDKRPWVIHGDSRSGKSHLARRLMLDLEHPADQRRVQIKLSVREDLEAAAAMGKLLIELTSLYAGPRAGPPDLASETTAHSSTGLITRACVERLRSLAADRGVEHVLILFDDVDLLESYADRERNGRRQRAELSSAIKELVKTPRVDVLLTARSWYADTRRECFDLVRLNPMRPEELIEIHDRQLSIFAPFRPCDLMAREAVRSAANGAGGLPGVFLQQMYVALQEYMEDPVWQPQGTAWYLASQLKVFQDYEKRAPEAWAVMEGAVSAGQWTVNVEDRNVLLHSPFQDMYVSQSYYSETTWSIAPLVKEMLSLSLKSKVESGSMSSVALEEWTGAPPERAVGTSARLILDRSLPILAQRSSDLLTLLTRPDLGSPRAIGALAALPGSEVLATLLALAVPVRDTFIENAALSDEGRRSLREALRRLGDPTDPDAPAAAVLRAFPDAARPYDDPRKKVDFGIITLREDEHDAVLARFPKVETVSGRRRYRIRSLPLAGGERYTIAVVRCVEQGTTDALSAARDLFEDLDPAWLLVVGIAGGVPASEFTLGDVVVSTRIADFSVEAVIEHEAREYALGGGPLHPDAAKLAADIRAMVTDGELSGWSTGDAIPSARPPVDLGPESFYGDAAWQKRVRETLSRHFADGARRAPRVVAGAVASSDRLIKDTELLGVWFKMARQIQAVEMESAGVYKAAHGRSVPFLAIRGISDIVGHKRHPDWTAYACHTAAAFTRALLLTRPVLPRSSERAALAALKPPAVAATEYRLSLDKIGAELGARWDLGSGATERFVIAPKLTPEDLAEHRWYLEEYILFPGPGDHARARAFEQRLEAFGRDLHRALFHDGIDQLRELARAPGPRLLTLTSKDAEALSLPWELLRDDKADLLFQDVILRRQLPVRAAVTVTPIPALPLRILLVIARPTDAGQIDARSSAAPMLDALDALGGQVHVELCDPPTLAELERRLGEARNRGERFHVVHFDGHGVYLKDLGVGALCFEKADATKDLVVGRDLGDLLARMEVPLALLEACQTADLSKVPVFGSVAPALLSAGVGSVVAFSYSVTVTAARILVERFYQEVCKGKSVGEALNAGRAALKADKVRHKTRQGDLTLVDWHVAQLYQAGPDPVLVPVGGVGVVGGTEPLQRGKEPGHELAVEPMYGFHGRAAELLKLHRRLRGYGAVVLQGGGGMGKTSLAREAARWWHRIGLRPGGAAFFSFESRQGADRAVLGFVQYVEGDAFTQGSPEDLWQRAVQYFREREVLWVWDNFESTLAQYQKGRDEGSAVFVDEERDRLRRLYGELTRRVSKGWLVVTCRPEATGLPGIAEMVLGGLGKTDALDMAREILARKDVRIGEVGYDREAVEELLEAVERHPLSIELVMAHAKVVKPAEAAKDLRKVVAAASQAAGEDRNKSLLASLRWSTERLREETRGVLPYLAWFDGGAFEAVLERFCDVGPEVWGRVREELLATALVRVDDGVRVDGKPYLGFHPTLPYAAEPDAVRNKEGAEQRYVEVYLELTKLAYQSLGGAKPAGAMAVMTREEGNIRRATALALGRKEFMWGAGLAELMGNYLEMAGRVRDRTRLAAWVQERMAEAAGPARWATNIEHAWGLYLAGRLQEAVSLLEHQIEAIDDAGDGSRWRAHCQSRLGRIWVYAGEPSRALEPLKKAIAAFEALSDRGNLAAAMGEQANAFRMLGRLPEALASAERAVAIDRERGDARGEAAGVGRIADILVSQHRFSEAKQRFEEALMAARRAGDGGLEGKTLQRLGSLANDLGQNALAVARYKEALACFEAVEDRAGEMHTADMLGTAETNLGHHEAARAWYAEAERLARNLGHEAQLGATAQNVGVLLQQQALALPEDATDERRRLLGEAATSVATSLTAWRKLGNEAYAAGSLSELGVIHRLLGNVDEAEHHTQQALATREHLDLPDVYKDYANLEAIADARNRSEEAAAWRAKKEAKIAHLQRLAQGDGPPRLPPQARDAFLALRQALHAARSAGAPIPLDAANTITQLATQPDPLGAAGRFLQQIAAGEHPDPPAGLPAELTEIFVALVRELRALPGRSAPPPSTPPASTPDPPPAPSPAPLAHGACPCGSGRPFLDCHGADG